MFCASEHRGARVDADDFKLRVAERARAQEVTVPDACDQEALAMLECIEMGDAGALQARAGEETFHPSIVRCEEVEGHGRGSSENVDGITIGSERTRMKTWGRGFRRS